MTVERLSRWYQTIAVGCVTLLLLFGGANLVLWGVAQDQSSGVAAPTPAPQNSDNGLLVYTLASLQYDWSALRTAYAHMSASDMVRLILETINRTQRCDPDMVFRETPFQGQWHGSS